MPTRFSRRDLVRSLSGRAPLRPPEGEVSIPFEHHLLSRATFGRRDGDVAELQAMGAAQWLEHQLAPHQIDDSELEGRIDALVDRLGNNAAGERLLARALYSKRQLAWRMTHFLNNHFSTNRLATRPISEVQEDEAFHFSAFSDFRTVLTESAKSPAMIDYLNTGSNTRISPNENYARELMELHTLGVNGGYTESDVTQAARVFTGWDRVNVNSNNTTLSSYFLFRSGDHDPGSKSMLLGWSTPGISGRKGEAEGLSLLEFLASHPATATFFTYKLCRYFVSDDPPTALLNDVRSAFVASGGRFRDTLRALFLHPEFDVSTNRREKVHDGFEFVVNLLRRLDVLVTDFGPLHARVAELGGAPHLMSVPTGWPEDGPAWQGAGNALLRWKFVYDLVYERIRGVRVNWVRLFEPVPADGAAWVGRLAPPLLDSDVTTPARLALAAFMDQRMASWPSRPKLKDVMNDVRDLTSLVLRLPEAQLH